VLHEDKYERQEVGVSPSILMIHYLVLHANGWRLHVTHLERVTKLDDKAALDIRMRCHSRCKRERAPLRGRSGDEMREADERDAQAVADALHSASVSQHEELAAACHSQTRPEVRTALLSLPSVCLTEPR
jgi:hypothetical protein